MQTYFPHFNKNTGYRSRAAFKLIQMNRKFEFLEKSRVCIDLCAAPGGWLQVASKFMPVSSVIIGVDLVPIKPIHNVISLQADITTVECATLIENNLSTWKADLVLHDGAPNVGKNWLQDAYSQNVLVLNALKLACRHLDKGGWFITKVFRSSDYNSLIWVLGKLFGKVHATKPQASRSESAEIFVVCQYYLKPAEIDPKFFDPASLFADISDFDETLKKQKADLLKPASKIKKPKAIGYESTNVFKSVPATSFIVNDNHMDILAQCHEIKIDHDDIRNHQATTVEIIECCNDIRILGRKELLNLIEWRRTLRKDIYTQLKSSMVGSNDVPKTQEIDDVSDISDVDPDEESVSELKLDDIEMEEEEEKRKEAKKIKRKEEKRKKDYEQRVHFGMVNHGDILIEEEHDLFSLKNISGQKHLDALDDASPDTVILTRAEEEERLKIDTEPDGSSKKSDKKVTFSRVDSLKYFNDQDDGNNEDVDDEEDTPEGEPKPRKETKIVAPKILKKSTKKNTFSILGDDDDDEGGGLLTDLEDIGSRKASLANRFFDRDTFGDIDLERGLEIDEIEKLAPKRRNAPGENISKNKARFDSDSEGDKDSEDDSDEEVYQDASEEKSTKKRKDNALDPEGLAIASLMLRSKKTKRDIEDEGWNRYTHADTHLAPKWFREEESKYCRRNVPVSQELVNEYKQKLKEIDAKPIKKVIQAKARKKKRALRKMDKVRKKVEAITSNEDITQKERIQQVRSVYKNATKTKRQEVKLVVGRKGLPPNKPNKGKYKMVDPRMKKDLRSKKGMTGKKGKQKTKSKGGFKPKDKSSKSSFKSKGKFSKGKSSKGKSKKGGARSKSRF